MNELEIFIKFQIEINRKLAEEIDKINKKLDLINSRTLLNNNTYKYSGSNSALEWSMLGCGLGMGMLL